MGTVTFFTVLPGFSCSNFSLSSIRTGALLGSVHMKLGQRISAASSTVGMQSNTAKLSDLATFLFMLASSLDKWVVPNPSARMPLQIDRGST